MFDFTVKPDGGDEFRVTATSRDVYVFEKATKGRRSMASITTDMHMSDMYGLAHLAATRQQMFTDSLDQFAASCDIDLVDVEEPDPTPPARSPEA